MNRNKKKAGSVARNYSGDKQPVAPKPSIPAATQPVQPVKNKKVK